MSTMSASANAREDSDHDRRRAGDEPAALLETHRDGARVVARAEVFLLHPRQEQHLVVHRETEDDAEHDHRQGRVDRTRL